MSNDNDNDNTVNKPANQIPTQAVTNSQSQIAMITLEQALAIVDTNRLAVFREDDGWHARSNIGGKVGRLHRGPRPTYQEAVEAAAATLSQADTRDQGVLAVSLIAALSRARYFIRPRLVNGIDPDDGSSTKLTVFDAFKPDNTPIAEVRGRTSFIQAVIDAEALQVPPP